MKKIESYKDLIVWQKGIDLAEACFKLVESFPKHQQFSMSSQIWKAAYSVPSNVAEGASRGSNREYIRFLWIAHGSLRELETHLILSKSTVPCSLFPTHLPMIRFENVIKRYADFSALKGVSLEVAEGQLVCLLGPSGCGKTTLLRTVNRLIEPTEGTIYIGDQNVRKLDEVELRRGIGYVIQSIGLFPHMSVLENTVVVPRLLGWDRNKRENRAKEMLSLVGLEPSTFAGRFPRELSGGQAQRVGLARALCADPPVLLMDEPFGAVDPPTRERLQDEFLKLQAGLRKTILFVTHDLEEAVKLSDRICLMNVGLVEQYDEPGELLKSPKTEFVREFIGSSRTLLRLSRIPLDDLIEPITGKPPRHSIEQTATARDAFSALLAQGARSVGVVDGEGKLLGQVRIESLLNVASEEGEQGTVNREQGA